MPTTWAVRPVRRERPWLQVRGGERDVAGSLGRGQHSLDLLLWREVAVGVPRDALGCDLLVLTEEFEGVGAGGGIVLLISEGCGFAGGLVFHAETTVDDGEDVVRGEVIGIDGLEVLVLDAGFIVFALLVEG